jgi:small-conductance mechanosensitive channel
MGVLKDFWESFRTGLLNGLPGGSDLARFLLQLVKLVLIGSITLYVARRIKNWAARLLGRSRIAPNVIALSGNIVFVLVLLLGFSWLLAAFGASWTAVLASLSVATVAISLSLQDVLKNFVAGIYLLLEQPFKIGDQLVVKGVSGQVEGIEIRTTILRTEEGLQVLIPNNVIFTEVLTNRSAYDTRRVALQLANVAAPFADLSRLVNEALAEFEQIERTPAPKLAIQKVEGDATTLTVEYWQRGAGAPLTTVLAKLKAAFPGADIAVTFVDGVKVGGTA